MFQKIIYFDLISSMLRVLPSIVEYLELLLKFYERSSFQTIYYNLNFSRGRFHKGI